MTTTDLTTSVPYGEVTDRNGRLYQTGETDRDIRGRPRWTMVLFPWTGMPGISSSEYAFTSAGDTLHEAHLWSSGHIFRLMGVWVFFQAAVAFPAGRLRESGRLPARYAMFLGALGTVIGCLSLTYAPHVAVAYFGFGMFSGIGAGLVHATCVNMVGKWYPERKGGKTGLVNGGFAYGSVPFGKDMGFAGGIVATAMSLKAIVNGTGRGVIRWVSDRFGRRDTLIVVCLVLGTAQFGVLVSGQTGSMPFFLFCSMVSGFGGGAILPLFAAMTADCFGENNNASDYGMVYSPKLVSGLVGSGMGAVVVGARDYGGAFLAGSIGIASAFLALFLKAPGRPKARGIAPNPQPLGEEMA